MEKCKWSFRLFSIYFQFTDKNRFQIIAKNKSGQYVIIYFKDL